MKLLLLIVSPIVAPVALLYVGLRVWIDFLNAKLLESILK